ncbi:MAG: 8-oxo-dGTP pyrophosphatase MutT (NUDIX family) [Candidatus Marivariicella framensis]|jgi:8-oxo-dGTP pyrophosphatase MutT (NUDIX family)|tara:strand:+ start:2754 stop:3398 length:645 start_codon:yes stop_codon:yes gene_type:complete
MKFSIFQNAIPKLKEISLPGNDAQIEMSSSERLKLIKKYKSYKSNALIASVLICVYKDKTGEACFVLMQRPIDKGVHSGQICLPGGKKESFDKSNWKTSIRETEEEVGLDAHDMNYVKALSSIYIPPSNFIVYPFIAIYNQFPEFKIDKNEVKKVFDVPFDLLLDDSSKIKIDIYDKYMNEIGVPAYNFRDNIVWGATAMILSEFKFLLKKIHF